MTFFISICNYSCKERKHLSDETIVSVFNKNLLIEDLYAYFPKGLSEEDSILFIEKFVNDWIIETLIFHKAQNELKDTVNIAKKVNDYRRQLYAYEYKNNMIYKYVNNKVSKQEIIDYYNKNFSDLVLEHTYVKAHYLTMDVRAETYFRERYTLLNTAPDDHQKLIDLCEGTGRRVFFYDDWIKLDDLLRKINFFELYNANRLIYENLIDHTDAKYRYLVKINDYLLEGSPMPLEIIEPNIINIIINKRKKKVLDQKINEILTENKRLGNVRFNKKIKKLFIDE